MILPRTKPRLEQWIRASRAEDLGLVRMLDESRDGFSSEAMIAAIKALPGQSKPSAAGANGLLDGLDVVIQRARALMTKEAAE